MRRIGCDEKKQYKKRIAIMIAQRMKDTYPFAHSYPCHYDNHWHVTTMHPVQSRLSEKLITARNKRKILTLMQKCDILYTL